MTDAKEDIKKVGRIRGFHFKGIILAGRKLIVQF